MMIWLLFGMFLVGAICIAVAIRNGRRAKTSLAWPMTQGRITSSRLVEYSHSSEHGDSSSYGPKVEYEYGVAGQTYRGKRVSFGSEASYNKAREQAVVERYKVGTSVEVFYDPASPADAVLERRAASSTVILLLVGVALIAMTLLFGLVGQPF